MIGIYWKRPSARTSTDITLLYETWRLKMGFSLHTYQSLCRLEARVKKLTKEIAAIKKQTDNTNQMVKELHRLLLLEATSETM
jgi:cell division protein FtsB